MTPSDPVSDSQSLGTSLEPSRSSRGSDSERWRRIARADRPAHKRNPRVDTDANDSSDSASLGSSWPSPLRDPDSPGALIRADRFRRFARIFASAFQSDTGPIKAASSVAAR